MKKIIIAVGFLFIAFGCNDDLTDRNDDPKRATSVPAGALLGFAEKSLFDQMTSTNVNVNVFRLFAQHWTETQYIDEARYDVVKRNVPDFMWRTLYRDVLRNLKDASIAVSATSAVTEDEIAIQANQQAILELLNVYTFSVLVDTYGNIPYTQALDAINTPSPVYDDAATIYRDLFARLDAALATMNADLGSFDDDFVYGGDVASWIKFGNSLKLRMAITVADAPGFDAISRTAAEEAATAGLFESNSDNTSLQYMGTQPNTNPLFEDLVSSGRFDFVAAAPLVDKMNATNDPRRPAFYTPIDGNFVGAPYGEAVDFESYSSAGDASGDGPYTVLLDPTLRGIILDYTEVEFYLAEAVERGYNVGSDAATHYNNAISSSIIYWGGSQADADAFLAQANVNYATAAPTWQQKIGEQEWVSFYNRGFEAWTTWRRLDYPTLSPPDAPAAAADGEIPKRFTYPVLEQTLNAANYSSAASAIGGDRLKNRIFWDIN